MTSFEAVMSRNVEINGGPFTLTSSVDESSPPNVGFADLEGKTLRTLGSAARRALDQLLDVPE